MRIYIAHPISGLTFDQVMDYYTSVSLQLSAIGYDVLNPTLGKEHIRPDLPVDSSGYTNPVSTDHAIVGRDSWMVQQCDIIYVNFTGARRVSIGCCMELAWAKLLNKHAVVAMEPNNLHRHAFVLESAHIVFTSHEEAMRYLALLGTNT